MKAVVMAGGEGSRLRPITANRPKPLAPICGRPIMEHILSLLKRHGITEVVATLHYLSEEIESYFGDGSEFGVNLRYAIEDSPLGTAGSVKQAQALFPDDEPILVISGDALTDCDLTAAIRFHREREALATLILTRVPNPLDFGVVITSEDGRVSRFLEKPSWSEVFSDTVNTGMYILEPSVFETMEPGKEYDWSQNVFPQLLREGKPLFGYVMEGYWADVGSLTQYRECHEDALNEKINLPIFEHESENQIYIGDGTVIAADAEIIGPVHIGRGCKIKSKARIGPYVSLGDHGFVEEGAQLERSVIWESAYIGPNVSVTSAIVGSRVTIKLDGKVMEDAVIGDRCLLDVGCTVRPRIKLWPDKQIERGAVVTMSLIWGAKWRGALFRDLGVAGLSNIEMTPEFVTRLASAFGSCLPPRSRVVTSRDSTRSSRMIKRAVIASLLSVGCDVLDLRSAPAPVMRHFCRASGAEGGVNVRKLPSSPRVTLVEMFDGAGAYVGKDRERKIETAFFREDFNRIDADDLGVIEFASRAIEEYQADWFTAIGEPFGGKPLRVVCDFGFTAMASIYPAMLARLGVETVSLNAFNNSKAAPRTPEEVEGHLQNLRQIVSSLGYDLGALFLSEGERLVLVDSKGKSLTGFSLFSFLATLLTETSANPRIAMPVQGPKRLEDFLVSRGATVIRTPSDVPSIQRDAIRQNVALAGDDEGGCAFPSFHAGFDAGFALGKLIALLDQSGHSFTEVASTIPSIHTHHAKVPCSFDQKGAVMRMLAEEGPDGVRIETMGGLKLFLGESSVVVLPDSIEPVIHLYGESETPGESEALVARIEAAIRERAD